MERLTGAGRRAMRAYDALIYVMFLFSAALIMFMAISVGYSVVMRYAFDQPIGWVVEGGEYMLLWVGFLAAPQILKEDGHARMTVVLEQLSPKYTRVLGLATSALGALICLAMVYATGDSVLDGIHGNAVYRGTIVIRQYIIWWIVPFSFALLSVQFVRMDIDHIVALREHEWDSGTPSSGSPSEPRVGLNL
jgi:TRAP-type C4-dicarboxylate transport system permease small subunit